MAMSRITGREISRAEHLKQSIDDILTTPIGSRVMRRDYGSLIPDLIDQPLIGSTVVRLYAAAAAALHRWEPRIKVNRVLFEPGTEHSAATLTVEGVDRQTGKTLSATSSLRQGAAA